MVRLISAQLRAQTLGWFRRATQKGETYSSKYPAWYRLGNGQVILVTPLGDVQYGEAKDWGSHWNRMQ